MAFEPSYNILDKDTHNMVVEAFKSGGIGYTEADGTVHKISGDYVEGGGGGGGTGSGGVFAFMITPEAGGTYQLVGTNNEPVTYADISAAIEANTPVVFAYASEWGMAYNLCFPIIFEGMITGMAQYLKSTGLPNGKYARYLYQVEIGITDEVTAVTVTSFQVSEVETSVS